MAFSIQKPFGPELFATQTLIVKRTALLGFARALSSMEPVSAAHDSSAWEAHIAYFRLSLDYLTSPTQQT
jgi:hypothetical protein